MFNKIFKKAREEKAPARIDLIIQKVSRLLEEEKVNIFELMDISNFVNRLTFENFNIQLKSLINKTTENKINAVEEGKEQSNNK